MKMSPQRKQMDDKSSPDKLNSLKVESSKTDVDERSKKMAPMKTLTDRKSTIRLGTLVWGKLDKWPWWPGLIISHEEVGLPVVKKQGSYYILWFGPTKTVSELPAEKLSDFLDSKLNMLINQQKQNNVLQKAIGEALRALSQTQQDQSKLNNASFTKLKSWAIQLLVQKEKLKSSKQVVLNGIPSWLEKATKAINATNKRLKKISQEKKEAHLAKKITTDSKLPTNNNKKIKIEKVEEVEDDENDEELDDSFGPRDADIAMVERIKCGSLNVENFCLGCHTEIMGPCMEHPLFFGGLCYGDCKMELLKTSYGIGEDSIHVSCAVCGSTGKCLICDKESCSRVYCPYCVELMVGPGAGNTIMQQTPWMCFLCTPYSEDSHGLLKARPNWPIRLRNFLHPNVSKEVSRHWMKNSANQPQLRVVVLHDNLGSVEFALRQLGLKPNQYCGSDRWEEIYEMNSVQFHILENINEWDDEKLSTLCPVDLLVSCLPVVQPKRKVTQEQSSYSETSATTSVEQQLPNPTGKQVGLRLFAQGAAGEAFLHFDRIRWSILRYNGSTPLLWAVENVSDYHMWISRNLEMEPMIFTVKDRQNVSQSRLVWTNIPEDFTKKQLDDEQLMSDFSSSALGPRSREPFFIKYPWILEDIIACNQEIPASWLERKKRERFQRETRIRTKTLKPNNYAQLSGASENPSSSENGNAPRKKKKKKDPLLAWKCPGIELMSSTDEEEDSTDIGEELADLRSFFQALGFPILFSDVAVKLPKAAVERRLNRCLPISLWMKIFTPLLTFMPSNVNH